MNKARSTATKIAWERALKTVENQTTPHELHKAYQEKIDKQIIKLMELEEDYDQELKAVKTFWKVARDHYVYKNEKGRHRAPVDTTEDTVRERKPCPVAGCPGTASNIKRHMGEVHPYLTREDQETILKHYDLIRDPEVTQKSQGRIKYECPICSKTIRRLDAHLQNFHKLDRSSGRYETLLRNVNYISIFVLFYKLSSMV